jgi:cytochrome c-type biogenesis protein
LAFENLGLVAAGAAGAVSFLSPCVLPLVPGYVSFIAGNSDTAKSSRFKTLVLSLCFVAGFSLVFVALGASTTLLSSLLLRYRTETAIIGGLLIIVFGLFTAGILQLPLLQRDLRFHRLGTGGHQSGAFILGIAFGFGWTPCIGPVLGTILTLSSVSETAESGVVLLLAYSLGLGIPFILSAWFADDIGQRLSRWKGFGRIMKVLTGGIMVLMGAAMMTGQLQRFSYWLLEAFPILQRIG